MTFQFLCPQGHLLQGEEADMGMQCQCPQCGTAFIIPTIEGADGPSSSAQEEELGLADDGLDDVAPAPAPAYKAPAAQDPAPAPPRKSAASQASSSIGEMDFDQHGPAVGGLDTVASMANLLHIPCPNGHELETPPEMIGQRVLCPHCRAEFTLRREKSIEYLHQQELLERKRAQFWFQASIAAAAVVGLALLVMIVLMFMS